MWRRVANKTPIAGIDRRAVAETMIEVWWTDDEGQRWRVTDVVAETRDGKRVPWPVQLGDSYAKWRVFTRDDGSARRVYRFRDEQHGVTGPTRRRQFLASEPQ